MAHPVGYKHGNTVIPFDSDGSYVVCDMPERQEKYKIHDKLGRSEEERKFIDSFERIFYAAAEGDLKICQLIVEQEKFAGVDAYSIGKFANEENGKSLDYVSPRQVAQMNGHSHVTAYFAKCFGGEVRAEKKQTDCDQLLNNSENKKTYDFHKTTYKESRFQILVNAIQLKILSVYHFEEQIKIALQLKEMSNSELFEVLELCCREEFPRKTPLDAEKRVELCALRDIFAESLTEEFPRKTPDETEEGMKLCALRDILAKSLQFQKTDAANGDIFCDNSEDAGPTPGCILFGTGCSPEFEFLDIDYPTSFEFGGRHYLSATSAYIAQQFLHYPALMDQVAARNAEDAIAFSADHYKEWDAHADEWFPKRKETMAHVLRAKFGQNPSLQYQLLLTDNFYLSFHAASKGEEPFWSDDSDGSGENHLGNLLMALRKEYGGSGKVAKPDNYEQLLNNF